VVETGIFPLFEIENGQYKLSFDLPKLRPIKEYLKLQGRFRHLSDETISLIQDRIKKDYSELVEKTKNGHRSQTIKRKGRSNTRRVPA
jgi:pyruvate ferredoxin oxidoreductase beta subunit